MRARQSGRSRTDNSDAPASRRRPPEHRRSGHREVVVGRMPLQQTDLDRLVLVRVAHAGLLAQHLGRADARAHAAEHVGLEDRARRAARVVLADPADERRDVDPGRAGAARRIVAVVATLASISAAQGQRLWASPKLRRTGAPQAPSWMSASSSRSCGAARPAAHCGILACRFFERANTGRTRALHVRPARDRCALAIGPDDLAAQARDLREASTVRPSNTCTDLRDAAVGSSSSHSGPDPDSVTLPAARALARI